MTDADQTGRAHLDSRKGLAFIRLAIGLAQGTALYLLYRAADPGGAAKAVWPATQPELFAPLLLVALFLPVMLLAAVGRLRLRTLTIWTLGAAAGLALLAWHDVASRNLLAHEGAPFIRPVVFPFAAAALFIAHHLIVPADRARRWVAEFADYFDTAWKAGVQLALSIGFTGAFWLLLFLGSALFMVIGLDFLSDLLAEEWFSIPLTCLAFALAVQLTDVRDGLIRGVRTVALVLLSWLLLVITVLVAGFLAALPFTGLTGLWETGSATALVLAAAAALIILINTAYQDGRDDNLPPLALRIAARVAAVLLVPLIGIAFWGLALRIGQHGLTPDRIVAAACAVVGAVYAGGYAFAALAPFWRRQDWMQPLERTNVVAAVLSVGLIVALFSPLLDPARLSVADQTARLQRGAVKADAFDYAFLRFESGRAGEAALARLAASPNPEIARRAKDAQRAENSYDLRRDTDPRIPPRATVIATWPATTPLPADFVKPVVAGDPRYGCNRATDCLATFIDLNGDGRTEILLADNWRFHLFAETDGVWKPVGAFVNDLCPGHGGADPREMIRTGQLRPTPPTWPSLSLGERGVARFQPEGCANP